ncbi:MAG: prolyl oligopeptidase family serine peptidase [Gemmataceae bacterium]
MATRTRLSLLAALLTTTALGAGEAKTGFINKKFTDDAKYVVFVPHDYDGAKAFPVILFLHGAGETGSDGVKQSKVGLGAAIKKNEKKFEFIVVMPQSQKRTWQANSEDGKRALAILDQVMKDYKTDAKRIYLTGLSMGGFGTWSMATAHPERWAAIAPICGGGDPSKAEKIKNLPIWCFHGDADKVVATQRSRDMIAALKKAGANPRYDEYPGVGHNSWDRAYGNAELYSWFLKHERK